VAVRGGLGWIEPPDVVAQALVDAFLGAYAVDALFNLLIHPGGDGGTGCGGRVRALELLLKAIQAHPRVPLANCRDIAACTLEVQPSQ
jgi:hypothetical protein